MSKRTQFAGTPIQIMSYADNSHIECQSASRLDQQESGRAGKPLRSKIPKRSVGLRLRTSPAPTEGKIMEIPQNEPISASDHLLPGITKLKDTYQK